MMRKGTVFTAIRTIPEMRTALTVILSHRYRKGNFWIGTNGGGLNLFDRKKEKFRAYLHQANNPNSLIDDFVNDIIEDHSGNIWVATFWGMSKFNTSDFRFTHYLSNKTRNNTLSHNSVFCLFEDSKNRIWAGSRNGLNLYRPETQDFIFYTEKDDLAGNIIYGILEDDDGFLWISTNRGLTKFDPETAACINFSESDGLQSNEFFRNSVFKGIKQLGYKLILGYSPGHYKGEFVLYP